MKNSKNQSVRKGSLTITGCGLHPGHMTKEGESTIKSAEIVLFVTPNPLSTHHIYELNLYVENLGLLYESDLTRSQIYQKMADRMVELVEQGKKVCCVFYGHPGIFVSSTHMAMDRLTDMGYPVKMLPGISSDACLFADLNLDPGESGCQSYESSHFLSSKPVINTSALLLLWQIGLIASHDKHQPPGTNGLTGMTKLLRKHYAKEHQICVYEAPTLPGFAPRADWIFLGDLPNTKVKLISTLVIPALDQSDFLKERSRPPAYNIDNLKISIS